MAPANAGLDLTGCDVTIELDGSDLAIADDVVGAAVYIPGVASVGHHRHHRHPDALVVQGGADAAGIGGSNDTSGTITVNGGIIDTTGGDRRAGIGGGFRDAFERHDGPARAALIATVRASATEIADSAAGHPARTRDRLAGAAPGCSSPPTSPDERSTARATRAPS